MDILEQLSQESRWQQRRELVRSSTDAVALFAWLPQETEGWVRAAMAKAFGELGGPEAHKALEQLGHDDSGFVRIAAVKALDAIQNLEARFQLREIYARDEDHIVRLSVVETHLPLGESDSLGTLYATLAYQTDPQKRMLAIYNAILEVGQAIVPHLRNLWITETAPEVRLLLVQQLTRFGDGSEPALWRTALLCEKAPTVRAALIKALSDEEDQTTRAVFLKALAQEEIEHLRLQLLQALRHWHDFAIFQAFSAHWNAFRSPGTYPQVRLLLEDFLTHIPTDELISWLLADESIVHRNQPFLAMEISKRGAEARAILAAILKVKTPPSPNNYDEPAWLLHLRLLLNPTAENDKN
ncbi:HEAT repeat domain-containing protein [Armatimonas sp.]|uniref:HEAT repeat domain-containing protein n=1 Tax=Armatimonas sp. TaxID=1872638 RepID=UPI00286CCB10|nr:HEAT repeat domain-containing protein [Armatimonas sp.]